MVCTINGTPVHGTFQGATLSGTLSPTNSPGDTVFVAVHITKHTPAQYSTGAISGGGVTWTLVSRVQQSNVATSFNNTELWSAYAPGGLSGAITLTISIASDATAWAAFAISGANATTQLDPNSSLPAIYNTGGTSTLVSFTYSTTNPDDLILSVVGESQSANPGTPTGFTNLLDVVNSSGAYAYGHIHVDYQSVSTVQSSVATTYSVAVVLPAALLVAATSDAPATASPKTIIAVGARFGRPQRARRR